jgi:DNA-binding transcriptional LysR family regulator
MSQLECLVALADLGSFTEAADSVGLTQSAVSHALAALERELGVTLLERNRRGVGLLTDVGRTVLPHARALLGHAGAIGQAAKAAHGQAAGRLRLGSIRSLCPHILASTITWFRQRYPNVAVSLFEGTPQEVAEWIDGGVVDVGFVLHPTSGLASTLVGTDELFVLVAPGHPLHTLAAVAPGALAGEDLIMSKTECAAQLMEMAGLDPGRGQTAIRYQASDSATVLAMVREGLGITIMPRTLFAKQLDGVVAVPFAPARFLQIGLAARAQSLAAPAVAWFVQAAIERAGGVASAAAPFEPSGR